MDLLENKPDNKKLKNKLKKFRIKYKFFYNLISYCLIIDKIKKTLSEKAISIA